MEYLFTKFMLLTLFTVSRSYNCPLHDTSDEKAVHKLGLVQEPTSPITLDKIKSKLKESGIFDTNTLKLNDMEKKELKKVFEAVEIMTTSRNRQPQNVQNMFSSLRLVERVVKKQLKEGQISESLASKFHWEKLSTRQKREKTYVLNKTKTWRKFQINNSTKKTPRYPKWRKQRKEQTIKQ